MRHALIALLALLAVPACMADETLTGYGAGNTSWQLVELDGKPFIARASLAFGKNSALSGQAPCNRYFGTQSAPYPWFKAEGVGATRMACPDLAAETVYFAALTDMTLAEVQGSALILSNAKGREMVFTKIETRG